MVCAKTECLSEEKIAVHYDYSSSLSSDENDSIKTPSRSSSPDTNMEDIRSADFVDNILEPTANPPEVRNWIRSWFAQRSLHQHYLDHTIDKLHWTGQYIHDESKAILEGDLATLGFKLYARSLALDIVEARGGTEEPQKTSSIEIPDSIKEEDENVCKEQCRLFHQAKRFGKNSEGACKAQVQEHDEELTRLRYFSRFTSFFLMFLLNELEIVRLALWLIIMFAGGYMFFNDMKRYLEKRAFVVDDERSIQENEKRSQQRKSRDEDRMHCGVSQAEEHHENKKPSPVKKEDEEIGDFPSLNIDYNMYIHMWLNWFCVEMLLVLFNLPHFLRTFNLLWATCFFAASEEGVSLVSSGIQSILKKADKFRPGPGIEQE